MCCLPIWTSVIALILGCGVCQPRTSSYSTAHDTPVSAVTDFARFASAPQTVMENIIQLCVECPVNLQGVDCRSCTMPVGTGRYQWSVPAPAQCDCQRMAGDPYRKAFMLTAEPSRYLVQTWQYPGDRSRICPGYASSGSSVQRLQERLQLFETAGYENQPVFDPSLFQFQQSEDRRTVERVTSYSIHRLCRIGDNATGGNATDCLPGMPAHRIFSRSLRCRQLRILPRARRNCSPAVGRPAGFRNAW